MANDQKPRRDRDSGPSRLDTFNAFVRRMPEWAYLSVVFVVGVVGAGVYLIATAL